MISNDIIFLIKIKNKSKKVIKSQKKSIFWYFFFPKIIIYQILSKFIIKDQFWSKAINKKSLISFDFFMINQYHLISMISNDIILDHLSSYFINDYHWLSHDIYQMISFDIKCDHFRSIEIKWHHLISRFISYASTVVSSSILCNL